MMRFECWIEESPQGLIVVDECDSPRDAAVSVALDAWETDNDTLGELSIIVLCDNAMNRFVVRPQVTVEAVVEREEALPWN
ncbi:MAG: hypothetical protein EOM24_12335 [Chloroflexia bacterium]|nr:hypothetical protein [Chloroflexia bacterium]